VLMSLLPSVPRLDWPSPPGIQTSRRTDYRPDGWEVVHKESWQSGLEHLDRVLIRATSSAARGLTRRRFLKRTGQLGALAAGTMSGLLWRMPSAAADPCYNCPSACGPSPICSASYCTGSNCTGSGQERRYGQSYCGTPSCWGEDCCTPTCSADYGIWNCCDCCAPAGGLSCSGSCSTKKRCICRAKVGNCV
jgi:hypothetical protein